MKIKNYKFKSQQYNLLDLIYNGDFKGVWSVKEDYGIEIDVFILYQIDEYGKCVVVENEEYRFDGSFEECIQYIHCWL